MITPDTSALLSYDWKSSYTLYIRNNILWISDHSGRKWSTTKDHEFDEVRSVLLWRGAGVWQAYVAPGVGVFAPPSLIFTGFSLWCSQDFARGLKDSNTTLRPLHTAPSPSPTRAPPPHTIHGPPHISNVFVFPSASKILLLKGRQHPHFYFYKY